jgi:N-acetylglucosamine malate deacetylase 1
MNRILAVGAHADDVELGCGGTLLKWAHAGHDVTIFVVTDSQYAGPDGRMVRTAAEAAAEAARAAEFIGARLLIGDERAMGLSDGDQLNRRLLETIDEVRPDILLVHWDGDSHPDHAVVARAGLHVARRIPTVLCYASNWYPGRRAFNPRLSIDISEVVVDKVRLIEMFESENRRTGGSWVRHARDQAATAGRAAGVAHAEAFEVHKCLLSI